MDEVIIKLKQTMADCNKIVSDKQINQSSYTALSYYIGNWICENEKNIKSKIPSTLQNSNNIAKSKNLKTVPQVENKRITSKTMQKNIQPTIFDNSSCSKFSEIVKYNLK